MGRKIKLAWLRWRQRRRKKRAKSAPRRSTSRRTHNPVRRHQPRRIGRKYIVITAAALLVALFAYSYRQFDRRIIPLVLEAAEMTLQTDINNVINASVTEIIREMNISASDLYTRAPDAVAGTPVLSVNTVLANDICNLAAQRISERLNTLEPEVVRVPMGMAFNLDTLSQVGPRFTFTMAPIGNALVDFDSRFIAVGINQVHFSLWLDVQAVVRIINPVHSFEVEVTRRILLVDTVISGEVPETYLSLDGWRN